MPLDFVTISGSLEKFPAELATDMKAFEGHNITVLSPPSPIITSYVNGFVSLKGDLVPRIDMLPESCIVPGMKRVEDRHLQAILQSDALWLMLPDGYCGPSTSCEIGWALAHNIPVFYDGKYTPDIREPVVRMYVHPTKGISDLVRNFDSIFGVHPITSTYWMGRVLSPRVVQSTASRLNADIAVGPVIVDCSGKRYRAGQPRDILLVKTYKWGDRFSIVGARRKKGEKLPLAFQRVVFEQTGLESSIEDDICVFDELPESGYHERGTHRTFVDRIAKVRNRAVTLDQRAQEYQWVPSAVALRDFDLEPNARRTLELYTRNHCLYG